jgi:GR25 family glycosyltransferase involved in LPS biosynthesis
MFHFKNDNTRVISLSHRDDRRQSLIQNLREHGFEVSSFPFFEAIHDEFGGLGCAKSHLLALTELYCRSGSEYLCILEDDFRFKFSSATVDQLISTITSLGKIVDVFILGGTETIHGVERYPNTTELNIQVSSCFESQSTVGYICNRRYLPKLLACFSECVRAMEHYRAVQPRHMIYSRFAIDQQWKTLQRSDAWFCTIPMLGIQGASFSDIEGREVNYRSQG